MRNVRLAISIVAAAALVPLSASAAFAKPPANDHPNGAIAMSLGDTVNQDTTKATTDDQDAEANQACGAPFTNASVWYSYAASADGSFILDMAKSDYTGGFMVFVGDPSSQTLVNCGPTKLGMAAVAGTTYTIMVFSDTPVNGGNLVLSLKEGPPPPALQVTVDPAGQVFSNGKAQVSGTYSCTDANFVDMEGQLTQIWRRVKITGFFRQVVHHKLCDGQVHAWTRLVTSPNGLYASGDATLVIKSLACGKISCSQVRTKKHVTLAPAGKVATAREMGSAAGAARQTSCLSRWAGASTRAAHCITS